MPVIDEKQELAKKSDLATKQDTLIPGTNITIAPDGKTISAAGGGNTVSVSPTLSSGTPIAAITVDGNINTLFAPTPPTISINQTQLSGVNLATITVNGTPFTIYAPEGTVVLSGTSAPTSAQGNNNDLYVQYTVASSVYTVDMTYVKLSGAWIELAASGSEVEPNPQGATTASLSSIGINGVNYAVDGLEENWTNTDEYLRGTVQDMNELGWNVRNDTYYYDTAATWSCGGNTYTKTNSKPALGCVFYKSGNNSGYKMMFASTDSSAAEFTGSSYYSSYTLDDRTWYYHMLNISSISDLQGITYYGSSEYIVNIQIGLINDSQVYSSEYTNKFSQISTPITGHLFTGGGSQANLSDATFDVESDGTIHGKELKVSDDVKINNVSVLNNFTGATSSTAGAKGMVPAPTASDYQKYLKGDGTWDAISPFTGATDQANGSAGMVPAPLIADKDKFLKGDGTWTNAGNVDDVNVNGVSVLDSNKIAQITSYREVTQAEYDALPASKLSDNILYCINDQMTADTTVAPIIYSEEEREVGVWTDGKPLYQKTVILESTDIHDGSYQKYMDVPCDNPDNIIDAKISLLTTGGVTSVPLPYVNTTTIYIGYFVDTPTTTYVRFQLRYGSGITSNYFNGALVVLRYTKTTDTPGSGKYAPSGVPAVHYSENEQVVGTWVDGSTLYEKTVVNSSTLVVGNNSISIPTDATSIVNATGIFVSGSYSDPLNNYAASTYGTLALDSLDATSHTLRVRIGSDYSSFLTGAYVYITIRYTKTTS